MTLEEQKRVEDRVARLLAALTIGEKAILYKTLYAEGLKIGACDAIIRQAPAPQVDGGSKTATLSQPLWRPASKFP
ncbi:MAG: hypothetical protein FJ147_28035 [Deltaproteobacteria bacterium]|nr:hypothetical protein [Deltaproteobacteria bacterium]